MLSKILSDRNLVIFVSVFFLMLLLGCSTVFLMGCEKQKPPPVSKAAPPVPAEPPKQPQPGGHFHEDGTFHADPHAPSQAQEVVEDTPPAAVEPVNPERLPYPMTPENRDIWIARVTEAASDPALLEKLLPETKERAFEALQHLANSVGSTPESLVFKRAMWRKMAARYPNDGDILYMHTRYVAGKTLAEKRAYTEVWERLKRINDTEGIHITSDRRKTGNLSQFYLELGEGEKALENMIEQSQRLIAVRQAGIHDMFMYHGLLVRGSNSEIADLRRQLRDLRAKKGEGI